MIDTLLELLWSCMKIGLLALCNSCNSCNSRGFKSVLHELHSLHHAIFEFAPVVCRRAD